MDYTTLRDEFQPLLKTISSLLSTQTCDVVFYRHLFSFLQKKTNLVNLHSSRNFKLALNAASLYYNLWCSSVVPSQIDSTLAYKTAVTKLIDYHQKKHWISCLPTSNTDPSLICVETANAQPLSWFKGVFVPLVASVSVSGAAEFASDLLTLDDFTIEQDFMQGGGGLPFSESLYASSRCVSLQEFNYDVRKSPLRILFKTCNTKRADLLNVQFVCTP